jgi:hypothetical protein
MANYSTDAFSASATFTPAAASHVAGDVIGAEAEFAFLDRNGGAPAKGSHLNITSATLRISGGTIETTAWRLHLYNATPPSSYDDDGAWDIATNDIAIYLGYVDFSQVLDFGTTLYIDMPNLNKQIKLAAGSSSVFGYLVNGTTLTPQAVAHVVTLHAVAV